jgi:hypothetical protein
MSEWYDTVKDLTAGTIGGCAGIVVGQPLDTIKVRLQAQGISSAANAMHYTGPIDAFFKMVKHEGPRSLFKGLMPPVIGNAPMNAIAFGAYGNASRVLMPYLPNTPADQTLRPSADARATLLASLGPLASSATPTQLERNSSYTNAVENPNFTRLFLAGCWSGTLQCFATTPAELIKCKLQAQQEGQRIYNGMLDCAVKMVRKKGWRYGLFSGWWATMLRDMPGMGAYFVAYEMAKWAFRTDKWTSTVVPSTPTTSSNFELPFKVEWRREVSYSTAGLLAAGGAAGIATWVVTYPFDVIKSVIQTLPDEAPKHESKIAHIARTNYAKFGASFFFRGLGTTLVRAVPVNAVTFWVYEECLKGLSVFDRFVRPQEMTPN